jgi:hypothetical protein
VAQSGSAFGWGPKGRWFKSSRPDVKAKLAGCRALRRLRFDEADPAPAGSAAPFLVSGDDNEQRPGADVRGGRKIVNVVVWTLYSPTLIAVAMLRSRFSEPWPARMSRGRRAC